MQEAKSNVMIAERRRSYSDRLLAQVNRYQPADRESVLEFRGRLFGSPDPEHVTWMYEQAPSAPDDEVALWTWQADGRVEAHQGAIRTVLRIGGEDRQLSWAIDLFVSSPFRSLGIGAVLPSKVTEEADVVAGTEVSEAAQKSFERSGWSHLGNVPVWFRPIDGTATLRTRLRHKHVPYSGWLLSAGLRLRMHASRLSTRHYRLTSTDTFDQRADVVWNTCAPQWPLIAKRDFEWLRWRWDLNHEFETRKLWFEHGGEVIGWVVVATRDRRGLRAGLILDMLCPPNKVSRLLALVIQGFYSDRDVEAVYCKFRAPETSRALSLAGFVKRDSGFAMMVYADKLPESERAIVLDPDNWYLTAGDSDLDRVRNPLVEDIG
jgi:GNAT superfamily N-acetyltransferase